MLKGLIYSTQDEIWSEIMAKRIKSMRDNTNEGIFGSIPYSFMTESSRSRYTFSFIFFVVRAFKTWVQQDSHNLKKLLVQYHSVIPSLPGL